MAGITEDLKLLVDARSTASLSEPGSRNQLHAHLVVLTPGYKDEIKKPQRGPLPRGGDSALEACGQCAG